MIVFLNNQLLDEKVASVAAGNAGFLYGEGVFTTLRLYKGLAPDLEAHMLRLQRQAMALDIPFSISLPEANGIIKSLVKENELDNCDARLRWTVTRGTDPEQAFPITPSPHQQPTVLVTTKALPQSFDEPNSQGIHVKVLGSSFQRTHCPHLKTLNYLPSLLALREAHKSGATEAIILDQNGQLCEGAVSNVFLVHDGVLQTPPDQGQILAGLTRQKILDRAQEIGLPCLEQILTRQNLEDANEIFLCNSVRQILPAIALDDIPVAEGKVGPITRKLQQWYASAMQPKK